MKLEPAKRDNLCYQIGFGAIVLYLVLRGADMYGDPRHWTHASPDNPTPAPLRFLNTSKYPPSLLFLLMTLGPIIAALPLLERAKTAVAHVCEVCRSSSICCTSRSSTRWHSSSPRSARAR
jgi:uncharacterized membrane protein